MIGARLFLALVALLPCATPASTTVKYRRYQLYELVCCADIVVVGKITDIDTRVEWTPMPHRAPDTFTLEIEQTIVGQGLPKSIEIQCFENWTCASRWAKYEKGQREVVFLHAPNQGSMPYTILGAGDEGEMPLTGEMVFAHGYGIRGHMKPGAAREEAAVRGSEVPIAEFIASLRGFREHLSWTLDPRNGIPDEIRPAKDLAKVRLYAASSPTSAQLFADVYSSEIWRGPAAPIPELPLPAEVRTRSDKPREFGSKLCVLGDVDGDGFVDLAAGEPSDGEIFNQHGALRILFLGPDGGIRRTRRLNETVGSFPARMNEFAQLGRGVAPAGDLDGDGVPDLVVSATGNGGSWEGRGSVWALELNRDGSAKKSIALDGDEKLRDLGVTKGSGLGASIVALGDLDGDGFGEIAVGQDPEFDQSFKTGRSVFVISLGKGGAVRWARRIHDRSDGFTEDYSWFGESLAALGDVDGDGVPDMAVSESYCPDGGEGRGAVWIVCLNRDGTLKRKSKISDWSGNFEGHLHDGDGFGRDLHALGDIDADGVPDLGASTWSGLWILSLSRDGSVRAPGVLSTKRPVTAQVSYFTLLALPASPGASERRFILDGWSGDARGEGKCMQWYLRFDAKGQLQTW